MTPLKLLILILATSLTCAAQDGLSVPHTTNASPTNPDLSTLLPPRQLGPAIGTASQTNQGASQSGARYPHAWFAFEAGAVAGAIFEDARSYTSYEHQSLRKFLSINIPLGLAIGAGGWKLENSRHKPLRMLGHGLMSGAVSGYSTDYFRR